MIKLGQDFHPISKEQQLYKKKKKKQTYKGRTIPSKKVRGKITKGEYEKAVQHHGSTCYFCGSGTNLEMHHVKFRSDNGRGVHYNLRLLCSTHHRGDKSVHTDKKMRKELEELHEQLYGPHYYKDKFDLFQEGLINDTTQKAYEEFMKKESDSHGKT